MRTIAVIHLSAACGDAPDLAPVLRQARGGGQRMLRRCDGTDPNLVKNDPPWDPQLPPNAQTPGPARPCDCGKVFDDVDYSVVYPHPPVGGYSIGQLLATARTATARTATATTTRARAATMAIRRSPLAARRAAPTLSDRRLNLGTRVQLYLDWRDLWVGVYVAHDGTAVYVCLLPCVVLRWRRR